MLLEVFIGAYCKSQTQTLLIRSMNGCQRTCLCDARVGILKMRPLKVFMKQTQQTKWRLRCSWLSLREFLWHGAATILPWRPDCEAPKGPSAVSQKASWREVRWIPFEEGLIFWDTLSGLNWKCQASEVVLGGTAFKLWLYSSRGQRSCRI